MLIRYILILCSVILLTACVTQVERKAIGTGSYSTPVVTQPSSGLSSLPKARKALVIGNGAYFPWERGVNAFGPLTNPKYDAIDMAAHLNNYGFTVTKVIDGDAKTLFRAINQFAASLGPTDVALLYYSGHGVTTVCNPTSGESHNYFVPVGRVIWDYADLCDTSVASPISAQWALKKLQMRGKQGMNILIFDACREVVEVELQTKGRGFERKGFTDMHGSGSFIAYAAAPGQSSWGNPSGRNSVYTEHLLKTLKPGQDDLPIVLLFQQLHAPVTKAAKRQHATALQEPWENNGLKGNFCFRAPCRSLTGPRISQDDLKKEQQARQQAEAENRRLAAENARLRQQAQETQVTTNNSAISRISSVEAIRAGTNIVNRQSFEPEMISIPAGSFRMGDIQGAGYYSDEKPVHEVYIKAFSISKYEITVGQFKSFVRDTNYQGSKVDWEYGCKGFMQPTFTQADNHPVVCVTWLDALAYTKWLSRKTGKKYRLPTEAEWEYVARAGTATKYWWGNEIGRNRANCDGCGSKWDNKSTSPVGSFAANPWGLYDTAGNVWEWTCSKYTSSYDGSEMKCLLSGASARVFRGGSWLLIADYVRAANRRRNEPGYQSSYVGFRACEVQVK